MITNLNWFYVVNTLGCKINGFEETLLFEVLFNSVPYYMHWRWNKCWCFENPKATRYGIGSTSWCSWYLLGQFVIYCTLLYHLMLILLVLSRQIYLEISNLYDEETYQQFLQHNWQNNKAHIGKVAHSTYKEIQIEEELVYSSLLCDTMG